MCIYLIVYMYMYMYMCIYLNVQGISTLWS